MSGIVQGSSAPDKAGIHPARPWKYSPWKYPPWKSPPWDILPLGLAIQRFSLAADPEVSQRGPGPSKEPNALPQSDFIFPSFLSSLQSIRSTRKNVGKGQVGAAGGHSQLQRRRSLIPPGSGHQGIIPSITKRRPQGRKIFPRSFPDLFQILPDALWPCSTSPGIQGAPAAPNPAGSREKGADPCFGMPSSEQALWKSCNEC